MSDHGRDGAAPADQPVRRDHLTRFSSIRQPVRNGRESKDRLTCAFLGALAAHFEEHGVDAIEQGVADGYWGNGLRADLGVKRGIATILLDVRRGDGPAAARTWTFPALITTERLVQEQPDIAAAAVRAIVKTQRALRAAPQLAAKAAQRLFPAEEASLIAFEVARDVECYDATVTEEMIAHASRFAREMGVLEGEVRYGELVATQFAPLWRG